MFVDGFVCGVRAPGPATDGDQTIHSTGRPRLGLVAAHKQRLRRGAGNASGVGTQHVRAPFSPYTTTQRRMLTRGACGRWTLYAKNVFNCPGRRLHPQIVDCVHHTTTWASVLLLVALQRATHTHSSSN